MSSLGRIVAGFIGGASGTALDFIKEEQKDKRELRKAELLQKLRLQTDKELADYQHRIDQSNLDKDLTTVEDGKVVMRDKAGNVKFTRDQTALEQEDVNWTRRKRSLDEKKVLSDIASTDADIGLKGAQAGYYSRGNRDSLGGLEGLSVNDLRKLNFEKLKSDYRSEIKEVVNLGVPEGVINDQIQNIITRRGANKLDDAGMEEAVSGMLQILKGSYVKNANGTTTLDKDAALKAKQGYAAAVRKSRGLDSK